MVVAGDRGFAGAARLCSEAAARTGSGLVSLATHPDHAAYVTVAVPEIMSHAVADASQLVPLLKRADIIAVGPGLGLSDWGAALFAKILQCYLPLVIDADALRLLANEPAYCDHWILTPHPGEAASLLAYDSSADIQCDRLTAAMNIQQKFGGVTVLKGSGTLIVESQSQSSICKAGNPGMASGGMGDVLTGVIAALLAQGMSLGDAATMGVCLHAAAGDAAASAGQRGMLASDLMPSIRKLLNHAD